MNKLYEFRIFLLQIIIGILVLFTPLYLAPAINRSSYLATTLVMIAGATCLKLLQIYRIQKFNSLVNYVIRLRVGYGSLTRSQRLYVNVVMALAFLAYVYVLDSSHHLYASLMIAVFCYCLGVVFFDLLRFYSFLYKTLIGKALIAIGFAISTNLTLSVAGILIGELTHASPLSFPRTLSFLAIFSIPIVFSIVISMYIPISILLIALASFFSMLGDRTTHVIKWAIAGEFTRPMGRYPIQTFFFQIFLYGLVGAGLQHYINKALLRYEMSINLAIRNSIYYFDMYPGQECAEFRGHRVLSLGNDSYLLATKNSNEITFHAPQKCLLK